VTEPLDYSCVSLEKTGRALKQCRLPRPLRPDDSDDVLAVKLQVDVLDGEESTVSSRQPARKRASQAAYSKQRRLLRCGATMW
jgi:hypothetical protein